MTPSRSGSTSDPHRSTVPEMVSAMCREPDAPVEERPDGDLVGGVEQHAPVAARLRRATGGGVCRVVRIGQWQEVKRAPVGGVRRARGRRQAAGDM